MGLGSNLGDPLAQLRRAVARLSERLGALRVSSVYRTEPVVGGARAGRAQPDYLNAVATGRTRLDPSELLAVLHAIEAEARRVRRPGERNAPRTLDLDLLLHGRQRLSSAELTVPHPRLAERRFVLAPLAELEPSRVVPGTGRTVRRLLEDAPAARVERLVGVSLLDPA